MDNLELTPYEEFKNTMADILPEIKMTPDQIIKKVETTWIIEDIGVYLKELLELFVNKDDLKNYFETTLKSKVENICIVPCSTFVPDIIKYFKAAFKNVYICDNFKKGMQVDSIQIIDQKDLEKIKDQIDAFLVVTRDPTLQQHFLKSIPIEKSIMIQDFQFFSSIVLEKSRYTNKIRERVDKILGSINSAKNPLIIMDGYYFNNFTPTYQSLEKQGYDLFFFSRSPGVYFASPDFNFHKLPYKNKFILSFAEMVYLVKNLTKGRMLTNTLSMICHNFDAQKAISSLSYQLTIKTMSKIPQLLFLYDVIDTIDDNMEMEEDYLKVYKKLLASVNGLILSSNNMEIGQFLQRSLNIKTPILSFFRHNAHVPEIQPRLKDGFHLAMIGQFMEYTRDIRDHIRHILQNRIHIHYYADSSKAREFFATLSEEQKEYFHLLKSIPSQEELIYQVSKCHAGWVTDSSHYWVRMINDISSPFIKDLMLLFRLYTASSSIMLLGSAGLPIFMNRTSYLGMLSKYPPEFFVPIELSEIQGIKNIIQDTNWSDIYKITEKHRDMFTVDANINHLTEFIESFNFQQG